MKRANSPNNESHKPHTEYSTLTKSKTQDANEYAFEYGTLRRRHIISALKAIWDKDVTYDDINKQIDSMPNRMHEVLDGDGRMIGH